MSIERVKNIEKIKKLHLRTDSIKKSQKAGSFKSNFAEEKEKQKRDTIQFSKKGKRVSNEKVIENKKTEK